MANWNFTQFHSILSQSKIEPFYGFVGEEGYLVEQSLDLLKKNILQEGTEDFNYNSFFGDEADMDEVKNIAETLPMMGERRLIILKDAHLMKSEQLEQLLELTSVPIDTTVVAVVFEKIDQRKKVFKELLKTMTIVDMSTPKEREIPMWIQKIAQSYQKTIAPQSAMLLHQFVGNKLIDLDNEIRKLSLYVGDRESIEPKDIEAIVSKSKIDSVFELTDAIGSGKTEKALQILQHLLDQGESEVGMLAMITRHVRLLLFTQEGTEQGLQGNALSSYVGVPPFFMGPYAKQAQSWSKKKIQTIYAELLNTDRNLKSVSISPRIFLENLILKSKT